MFRFSLAVIVVLLLSVSASVSLLNNYDLTALRDAARGRHVGERSWVFRQLSSNEQVSPSKDDLDSTMTSGLLPAEESKGNFNHDGYIPGTAIPDLANALSDKDPETGESLVSGIIAQAETGLDRLTRYVAGLTAENTIDLLRDTNDLFFSDQNSAAGVAASGVDTNLVYRQDSGASLGDGFKMSGNQYVTQDYGSSNTFLESFTRDSGGGFGSGSLRDSINESSSSATAGILGSVLGSSLPGPSNKNRLPPTTAGTIVDGNGDLGADYPLPILIPPPLPAPPPTNLLQPVPEPASIVSFSLILCGAVAEYRRRRRK